MADSRIDKWQRWLHDPTCDPTKRKVSISADVYTMHLHRYAFQEVSKLVEANRALPESYFLEYMRDTYATTQAVAVRRQAEPDDRVISLGRLVREIGSDAKRLTRAFWVGMWTSPHLAGHADEMFTTRFAPNGGDHLDPRIPERDLQTLTTAAAAVKAYVDKYVAHSDAKPRADLPTFAELDAAVEIIGDVWQGYVLLLTTREPTPVPAIQEDWLAIFREAWLK